MDTFGKEITEWDNPAVLNPIRWKSQYYDTDSGLYWIGQRWYDPERGRYISAASPEMLLLNVGVVYAINLYAFCISNPLAVIIAANTVLPSLELYFNGEMSWWDRWGKLIILAIVGIIATVVACAISGPCGGAATAATVSATIGKIVTATLVGAVVSLAVGGAIAGIQSALTGHGFWNGFAESVQDNALDALVTSFAFSAVTVAIGNAVQHYQCFKEGTLVETEDGLKPIEEIEVGDKVLAYDEETGEQAYKPVVQLFRNETKEWYHVHVNGEEIICTGGHPFYVLNSTAGRSTILYENIKSDNIGKWITAKELKHSDKLLLSDGTCAIIEEIEVEQLEKPETTYNFEVEDFHTYYVSDNKVLVHNMCKANGNLNDANYAQKTYREKFSSEGAAKYSEMAGRPINNIDDLSLAIQDGTLNPSQIKIDYIVRDGNTLIMNTRSAQALTRAGIPISAWSGVNRTGQALYENLLSGQLARNGLTSAGWALPISIG